MSIDTKPSRSTSLWACMGAMTALSLLMPAGAALAGEQVQTAPLNGSLNLEQGVPVLKVWGKPYEQGYAHGYLLADNIMRFVGDTLFNPRLLADPLVYESRIRRGLIPRVQLTHEQQQELEGILAGVRDKLGPEGLQLKRTARPMDVKDLIAINTLADWYGGGCSSFAAWGSATVDGGTIVGRNLDYLELPGIREEHLVIVRTQQAPLKKRTISIAWPGLIGVYTGLNEEGVFVSMHDAPGRSTSPDSRFIPRSLALREILETVPLANAHSRASKILEKSPALRGNNFLVAIPYSGSPMTGFVFEYDDSRGKGGGFTLRSPKATVNNTPAETIACTNHHRLRRQPQECNRYESIAADLRNTAKKIDFQRGYEIIESASVKGTMHSVVALLNKKEFYLYLASEGRRATENEPRHFLITDLIEK